jgi:hypothetical protein
VSSADSQIIALAGYGYTQVGLNLLGNDSFSPKYIFKERCLDDNCVARTGFEKTPQYGLPLPDAYALGEVYYDSFDDEYSMDCAVIVIRGDDVPEEERQIVSPDGVLLELKSAVLWVTKVSNDLVILKRTYTFSMLTNGGYQTAVIDTETNDFTNQGPMLTATKIQETFGAMVGTGRAGIVRKIVRDLKVNTGRPNKQQILNMVQAFMRREGEAIPFFDNVTPSISSTSPPAPGEEPAWTPATGPTPLSTPGEGTPAVQ